jgi:hypothetical protein
MRWSELRLRFRRPSATPSWLRRCFGLVLAPWWPAAPLPDCTRHRGLWIFWRTAPAPRHTRLVHSSSRDDAVSHALQYDIQPAYKLSLLGRDRLFLGGQPFECLNGYRKIGSGHSVPPVGAIRNDAASFPNYAHARSKVKRRGMRLGY